MNRPTPKNNRVLQLPVKDFHKHERWCYANRAASTHDFDTARNRGDMYERQFVEVDQAKWFAFDHGVW